jgi:hypothetical protein
LQPLAILKTFNLLHTNKFFQIVLEHLQASIMSLQASQSSGTDVSDDTGTFEPLLTSSAQQSFHCYNLPDI